ncbi:MAG: MBL fold metallo-hydrolase [Deltaproteobacteria bacterium]|nr:MAG: MBL fold metallo-hydrolase [Deltaproteobacteria bacterium]
MPSRFPPPIPISSQPDHPLPAVCMLASGSKGNAIYLSDGETRILIDAGLSGIQIEKRLKLRGISPGDLDAIIVSHEHSDHIRGVGVLARRFRLPVHITEKTAQAAATQLGKLEEMIYFRCGKEFKINTLSVRPFSISHDAVDPAGFSFQVNEKKVGFATDLGVVTHLVRSHLADCAVLILEANHDPDMLINGPYPWPLKQRVQGRTGHLSNTDTGRLLAELTHERLRHVVLAHLSETNNTPEKVMAAICPVVADNNISLSVASQSDCGHLIDI